MYAFVIKNIFANMYRNMCLCIDTCLCIYEYEDAWIYIKIDVDACICVYKQVNQQYLNNFEHH